MKYKEIRKNVSKSTVFVNYEVLRLLPNKNDSIYYVFPIICCQLSHGFKTKDKELLKLKDKLRKTIGDYIVTSKDYFYIVENFNSVLYSAIKDKV